MKVLALNLNYSNQNYNKKDVNFEAARVDADAIKGFKKLGFEDHSLTESLALWTVGICKNARCFGNKVKEILRNIVGVEPEGVFAHAHGLIDDVTKIKQDIYLSGEELHTLHTSINKANDEAEKLFYGDSQAPTITGKFDQLWDKEGTECNNLQKLINSFVEDANSEGHHVKQKDILPYAEELAENVRTYEDAKKGIDEAKELADEAVSDRIVARWFTPKPTAES